MSVHTPEAPDDGEIPGPEGGPGSASWLALLPMARILPAGTVLVRQGCASGDVFLLDDGLAKLARIDGNGREQILGLRGAGWFPGAACAMAGRSSPASAVAVTPCAVRKLPRAAFLKLLRDRPALSRHVHRMHSRELLSAFHHMAELGVTTARQRLERLLRRLAEAAQPVGRGAAGGGGGGGGEREVRLASPLKRSELASLIAVSPEHLSRLVRRLREDGVIRIHDGGIVVPDVQRLASGDADAPLVVTMPVLTPPPPMPPVAADRRGPFRGAAGSCPTSRSASGNDTVIGIGGADGYDENAGPLRRPVIGPPGAQAGAARGLRAHVW